MPWPINKPYPTVTIVMPVERHRGKLPLAIDRWSAQNYPRDKLDFVFVSNGREPQIDAMVTARLAQRDTPRGGVVYIKTNNEMAQYAFATRYARGEWLLFTESHCIAQLDCVSELIGTLLARGMVGGCVRTLSDQSTQRCARVEERMYLEDAALWSRDDDWRKFTKRGFALRRDVYRSIGGLESDYGWFSELIIAARLDAEGHRTGFVPSAAVQHFNSTDIHEVFDYVREYRHEMARFVDKCPEKLKPYFAAMITGQQTPPKLVARATQQAILAALGDGIRRSHTRTGRRLAGGMLRSLVDWQGAAKVQHAWRYWLARLRFAQPWLGEDQAYQAFMDAWNHLGNWAEATYQPRATSTLAGCRAANDALEIFPGETSDGLYGFHASERYAGRKFRWTSPAASLFVYVPPGDYDISLETGGLVAPDVEVQMYWNGQRIAGHCDHQRLDGAQFSVQQEMFTAGAPQVLTLIAAPLATGNRRETRALGLPLFGIHLSNSTATARRAVA